MNNESADQSAHKYRLVCVFVVQMYKIRFSHEKVRYISFIQSLTVGLNCKFCGIFNDYLEQKKNMTFHA